MVKFVPALLLFGALAFYLAFSLERDGGPSSDSGLPAYVANADGPDHVVRIGDTETAVSADPAVTDFAALDAAIERLTSRSGARLSIAILTDGVVTYAYDADGTYALASVAKLYLLAGYLDFLDQQDRLPDTNESVLLDGMIGWSDNFSAQQIWEVLGGNDAVHLYLESRGFFGLLPAADGSWGSASTTTTDTALFLTRLARGELLDEERTAYALSLLAGVQPSQRWGVTSGIAQADPRAKVLVKNGWYPEDEGWLINSAGLVTPSGGGAPYAIVVFADGIARYDDGLALVEAIASMANRIILAPPVSVSP